MVSGGPSAPRAPRLFVDEQDAVAADRLTIRGASVHRLSRVLRMHRGDPLEAVHPPSGRIYAVSIERLIEDRIEAAIETSRPLAPDPAPCITLCPAVIRAQRFDIVVEKATELGVSTIRPVRATRSLSQSAGRDRLARWRRLVTEAAEQCRREMRPEIAAPVPVEELLVEPQPAASLRIFASALEQSRRVAALLADAPPLQDVQILVGPEGGFTSEEARLALANGWRPVTLGPRPLRAETASVAALAVVQDALSSRTP